MQEINYKYDDRRKNRHYKVYSYTIQKVQPRRDEDKKLVQKCGMKNAIVTEKRDN